MSYLILKEALPEQETNPPLVHEGVEYKRRPFQAIVSVSLTQRGLDTLPHNARKFPALIDTGASGTFSISLKHLSQWAAIRCSELLYLGTVRVQVASGEVLDELCRYGADLWLHSNLSDTPPLRLELSGGFILYPGDKAGPSLPLIGLRALRAAGLRLELDYDALTFSIQRAVAQSTSV